MSYPEAVDVNLGGHTGDPAKRSAMVKSLAFKVTAFKWTDDEAAANLRVRKPTIHHLRHHRLSRLSTPVLESMMNMMGIVEKRECLE